jgi:asparagine synthase (glutamine-hydrolysing)
MCGLILAKNFTKAEVQLVLDAMEYRGKDGKQGITERGGWVLGHVRLAIQDLTDRSSQPSKTKDFDLAYVGEVFNLPEGLNEIETVVRTYDKEGAFGFQKFDGFWSVVAVHESGFAAIFTDFLGIKPLYYWAEKDIVCSELDAMFQLAPRPKLDELYFSNVIKWGYDPTGRTPYLGIKQLPPGTVLQLRSQGEPRFIPYWDWNHPQFKQLGSLHDELTQATLNRLAGDREVALLLSGGLDSSIIYHILKREGKAVQAFSIENGESEFLPPGVETLPIQHRLFDILGALEAMQAPIDLGSLVPQHHLAQALAAKGFNVCLSGDGADELFGGYRRAQEYDSQASDVFMELPYYHFPRLDRVMMRETVELRSPFLSPRVIALALRIPYEQRTSKQALKEAFKDIVPSQILNRPKLPLKTAAVIHGGTEYRKHLVESFKCL